MAKFILLNDCGMHKYDYMIASGNTQNCDIRKNVR